MRQIFDDDYGLRELIAKCYKTAEEHGWHDKGPITFSEAITLMHSELTEAFEEYRKGYDYKTIYHGNNLKPEGIPVEMADLLIRFCHYVKYFDIPIFKALDEKLAYNETRPYRHGDKKA